MSHVKTSANRVEAKLKVLEGQMREKFENRAEAILKALEGQLP